MSVDERQLEALCGRAFDLRGTDAFAGACAAIVDWIQLVHLRAAERRIIDERALALGLRFGNPWTPVPRALERAA